MRLPICLFVCVALTFSASANSQPSKGSKKSESVEDSWNRYKWGLADSELQCRARLASDDPTVEWKRAASEWQDDKYVVTAYGTRNMQMVTGVCHVASKDDKRKVVKVWIK